MAIRTTFDDAALDVENDYKTNGKRSLKVVEPRIKLHLKPVFGGRRLADISTSDVRAFIVARQAAGASNGEINRELQVLKRGYSLAIKARKAYERPHIELLTRQSRAPGSLTGRKWMPSAAISSRPSPTWCGSPTSPAGVFTRRS